jgi:hypothetical protein
VHPVKRVIVLSGKATLSTLVEELVHFEQLMAKQLWGKQVGKDLIVGLENDTLKWMRLWDSKFHEFAPRWSKHPSREWSDSYAEAI